MENSVKPRNWQVLLLGGASGVGKTSLSYRLAQHFKIGLTEVDDFQVILEKMTTPEQLPLLHFWNTHRDEFRSWTEEAQLRHFVRVCAEVFSPALEAVIANHLESNTQVVLEGDFILPALATLPAYEGIPANGQVKALFLYEQDEAQIARNYHTREGREQPGRARASWLFSEWLRQECARQNLSALPVRPWETGLERCIAALAE
jgi:2-phosphoglycerate kinase